MQIGDHRREQSLNLQKGILTSNVVHALTEYVVEKFIGPGSSLILNTLTTACFFGRLMETKFLDRRVSSDRRAWSRLECFGPGQSSIQIVVRDTVLPSRALGYEQVRN